MLSIPTNYLTTHYLELIASCAGLSNVYLAARNSIWNWFFGAVTVSLYLIIFYHAKLYADMSLQFIFLLLQFYGIHQWLYGGKQQTKLEISRIKPRVFTICLACTSILFSIIAVTLHNYTDSNTVYSDTFITALSLVAQWMMSRKLIEHWYVWIIVNVASINMYFYKNLYFTCCLYVIFILIDIIGYLHWKKDLKYKITDHTCSLNLSPE